MSRTRKKFSKKSDQPGRGGKQPSFKKTIDRDVTRTDQKEAADSSTIRDRKYSVRSGLNDPLWYAKDPALLRDAASIPFSWATGTNVELRGAATQGVTSNFVVPGVCALQLLPCCGLAVSANSAVNVAAQALYSFVRHANSGSRNYDNPDLMLYVLAMSNVYSAITWLERIYGESMLYAMNNRYMPDALLYSQGIAVDGAAGSLAEFRYGINLLINKASSFAVPSSFPIFKRHAFLFQDLFKDGASDRSQLYQFVPYGFYKYGLDSDGAGELSVSVWSYNSATPATYKQALDYVSSLLTPLLASEDIGVMSGDILKAYGTEGILKLATLDTNYTVEPVYDAEVLEQFKNSRGCNLDSLTTLSINQGTLKTYLNFAPTFTSTQGYMINRGKLMTQDLTITTQLVNPGPDVVMENTRLMMLFEPDEQNTWSVVCGTELVGPAKYYTWNYDLSTGARVITVDTLEAWTTYAASDFQTLLQRMNVITYFDMHPFHGIFTQNGNDIQYIYRMYDLDNWAVITGEELRRLHETATMSELHVDSVAKAYVG